MRRPHVWTSSVIALAVLVGPGAALAGHGATAADHGLRTARTRAALARIAATDTVNHAWLAVDHAGADAAAKALDDAATSGATPTLLDGMLIAVKDNLDTAGRTTTAGSNRLRARVPSVDATAVARVRAAGGVILGKTNLDTFARGVRTLSEVGGATGNAWDPRRSPGGSSGGSAVAVAMGTADAALGSDTCGSLRYPATYNGVFALRPTPGLVSRSGLVPLAPTQDVVGPLARTVTDLATLLKVISTEDPADPLTADAQTSDPLSAYTTTLTLDGSAPRLGVVRTMGTYAKDRSGQTVLDVLLAGGAELVTVTLPALPSASVIEDEYRGANAQFLAAGSDAVDGSGSGAGQPWLTRPLTAVNPSGYARRLANRKVAQTRLVTLLDAHSLDALVYPTTPYPAARRGAAQPSANCGLAATSGLPALAIPHRLGSDGLPAVGVDLLGRPFAEFRLLQIARRYERDAELTFPLPALQP